MERFPMTALSTSFIQIHPDIEGEDLVADFRDLPITGIELEYRLPTPLFHQTCTALRKAGIRVTSLHNFCPLPLELLETGGSGDLFSLSDIRREERQEAVKRTLQTIDHAHELEAGAVVLHCGRVAMPADTRQLYNRFNQETNMSVETRDWLETKIAERDRLKPAHLDALCFSLEKLLQAADRRHVRLGLETRYHYHELPGPDDFRPLLQKFEGAPVGYWHDTGHAFVNEQLGLVAEGRLLENLSDRLIGIHLHDAEGLEDHLPPGSGHIDFKVFAPHMTAGVLPVMELRPGTPVEAVRDGLAHLATILRMADSRT
jgi:sugar phosphate isomerase/epimerase